MKTILKQPALFLLNFIIILGVLIFFNILLTLIVTYADFSKVSGIEILAFIPVAFLRMIPAAVILALAVTYLKNMLNPVSSLPVQLILFFLAYIFLAGGLTGLTRLIDNRRSLGENTLEEVLTAGEINSFPGLGVFPSVAEGNSLQDTLIYVPDRENVLAFYPNMGGRYEDGKIDLYLPEEIYSARVEGPYKQFLYKYDQVSAIIINSFAIFGQDFLLLSVKFNYLLFIAAFVWLLFVVSSGIFTRITKWPLFNILLYGFVLVGGIVVYGFYRADIHPEIVKTMKNEIILELIPYIALTVISIIFILLDILFMPHKSRKEGTAND